MSMKQKGITMKINASRFLVGVLTFGAVLTVSLVQNNVSSSPLPGVTAGQERRIRERPVPANDKGSSQSQIEGIYLHLSYNLTGIGGTVQLSYPSYLLLKDGTIYRGLKTPPMDLDIAKSREAEPKKWGRWEKRGTSVIVQWNDGKRETWDKYWYIARPAKKTDRLKGVYGYITGGGSTTVAAAVNIEFSDDGSFVRKGVVSDLNNALYASGKSQSSGTYVLDGYTIELRYANGKTERHLFYFYPDSNNAIGIGQQAYTLDK
jgi:hypothetical protein